jgi:alanine racemase
MKNAVGPRGKLLAVLKADAYGHGAAALAPIAIREGASGIGVSSLEEGIALRDSGITAPILVLGSVFPLENFSAVVEYKLTPTISSLEAAQFLQNFQKESHAKIPFHLKVDTGMGRLGLSPSAAKNLLTWAAQEKDLTLAGVYSHFAAADSDAEFTRHQLDLFLDVKKHAETLGFKNSDFHIANSAAIFRSPASHLDLVRPGLALYGASLVSLPSAVKLEPVMRWTTQIVFLKKVPAGTSLSYGRTHTTKKESDIATLPVGYADGVPRAASNRGQVLVNGRRCPIVGRVTMDHVLVDVTGASAQVGDAAVLMGSQGAEKISADDWAGWADTISYEIFCGISKRVPRVIT